MDLKTLLNTFYDITIETNILFRKRNEVSKRHIVKEIISIQEMKYGKIILLNPEKAEQLFDEAVARNECKIFVGYGELKIKVPRRDYWRVGEFSAEKIVYASIGTTVEEIFAEFWDVAQSRDDILIATPDNLHHSLKENEK